MQSENTADPADRLIIRDSLTGTGDGFSLQNVNTTFLPNGALAWVNSNQALFALNKASTKADNPDQVVTPGSGPGRWERVVSSATEASGFVVAAFAANTYAANGNFNASTDSNFSTDSTSPNWALSEPGGIMTYSGPPAIFNFYLFSQVAIGTATQIVYGTVSYNNDSAGAAAPGQWVGSAPCAIAADPYSLSTGRRVLVSPGDTIRPKFGVASGAASLSARMTLLCSPG